MSDRRSKVEGRSSKWGVQSSATRLLAELLATVRYDDLPAEVIDHSRRAVTDWLGSVLDRPGLELLDEVRLLWHVMVQAAERLHERELITLGMRAVLEFVARSGPTAVPEIARSRHVTRQHIQALVNDLIELRLVSLDENPAHRRSALVRLTPDGQKVIDRMKRRERQFFDGLGLKTRPDDLRRAAATLSAVRAALGGRP